MTSLTLAMQGSGPGAGIFVAQLLARPNGGRSSKQTLLLELGRHQTIDVEPGHVFVQVKLPSGELLAQERMIAKGQDETITFQLPTSRHEWLGWQELHTQRITPELGFSPDFDVGESPITELRVHRGKDKPIVVPLDTSVDADGARYQIHTDATTVSLTIEGYSGVRPLVEIVKTDGGREIAAPPLPWYDRAAHPLPVQLIYEFGAAESRADVIIQDPVFLPMLAYYATGNRADAQELSGEIEKRAREAIEGKFQNAVAATAGLLVLRRMRHTKLPDYWFENLSGIKSLSDGAILYAQHLLEKKDRRSDRSRVRAVLLDAASRGVPIFSECGRLLRDGLRRVAAAERVERGDPKPTPEVAAALFWASELVDASRADTIITWLAADDGSLARIVPKVVSLEADSDEATKPIP